MNYRLRFLILTIVVLTALLPSCTNVPAFSKDMNTLDEDIIPSGEMSLLDPSSEIRGVWIASVYNIDFPTRPDLTADEIKAELDDIIKNCKAAGLNTIYFQVRGVGDALYESDMFPVSEFLSSDGTLVIDPLAYILEQAHQNNIRLHAWVNPFRIGLGGEEEPSPDSIEARYSDMTLKYADGKTYIDPGYPEMRKLVADGIGEIVEKYDVDGVIIDDYFYPYPVYETGTYNIAPFDDEDSYQKHGGELARDDWRRENVNSTVKLIYDTVKSIDSECTFGVSPFGVWRNNNGKNGGSNTSGFESYTSIYCDSVAWIKGGYIDYIAPQIVWRFSEDSTAFDTLVRWWNTAVEGTDVDLIVSHATYRYDEGEWVDPSGEIKMQVTYARSEMSYIGSIFYGYDEIRRNAEGVRDELVDVFAENIVYYGPNESGASLAVASPAYGEYINADYTYIIGSSDPNVPLYFNGEIVGRTKSGCFSLYVPIEEGENRFTFTQGNTDYSYVINGGSSDYPVYTDPGYTYLTEYKIVNPSPSDAIAYNGGEYITLICTAPYGSDVYAVIGDRSIKMYQIDYPAYLPWDGGYAGVRFRADFRLPDAEAGEVLDLGELIFTAILNSKAACAYSGSVRVLGEGACIPVEVISPDTHLKVSKDSLYYDDFTVQSVGMVDNAVRQEDGFYLLRCGGWVYEDTVREIKKSATIPLSKVSGATVTDRGEDGTEIRFSVDQNVPYNIYVENGYLVITLYNLSEAPPILEIEKNPLIVSSKVSEGYINDSYRYYCELYDYRNFYGFDLHYEDGAAVLSLKNPRGLSNDPDLPLDGVQIHIDAGHGGWDNGAAGPFSDPSGNRINEKDLNLIISLKLCDILEGLGASVTMTRVDDTYVDLAERAEYLRTLMPDLAVSVHQNSMPYSSDITKIRGTYALYWAEAGVLLCESISKSISDKLGRFEREPARQMLAMCKNPKFPSMLIECGFITCVEEYEFMLSEGCELAAIGIAEGILNYFEVQEDFLRNVQ